MKKTSKKYYLKMNPNEPIRNRPIRNRPIRNRLFPYTENKEIYTIRWQCSFGYLFNNNHVSIR